MTAKKVTKRARAKACDAMFSKLVRARDGACVIEGCGSVDYLQAAHGFSRSYHAVRWDSRNCFAMCRSHHVYYTHRPLEWDVWLHELWGDALYAEMRAKALTHRWPDMEALHAELSARLAEHNHRLIEPTGAERDSDRGCAQQVYRAVHENGAR